MVALSVFALRQRLFRDVSREDALVDVDELFNRLAIQELLGRLHEERALERIALDRAVRLVVNHGLEHALDTVDGNDRDVLAGLEAGRLDGLDGAERHVIVVREEDIDLRTVGFQEGLHDLLASMDFLWLDAEAFWSAHPAPRRHLDSFCSNTHVLKHKIRKTTFS